MLFPPGSKKIFFRLYLESVKRVKSAGCLTLQALRGGAPALLALRLLRRQRLLRLRGEGHPIHQVLLHVTDTQLHNKKTAQISANQVYV